MNWTDLDILYVITDLERGGVPLHLYRLAKAMRGKGYTCKVVSLAPAGPVGDMLREEGIEVYSCGGRGGWDYRIISRLTRIIRVMEPDIVHAMLFHANVAARRAARKASLPADRVICEIQTVEVERRWHLMVDRWRHRGCRFTIGNSPSVVEHLATKAKIPLDRLRLVRGGIDPEPYSSAKAAPRAELGIGEDARAIMWVGRLDPIKGLGTLVDAFQSVSAGGNEHLFLVGDGAIKEELAKQVEQGGLSERVHFLGSRDDVPRLLKAADLFVFPSRTEGLPNALLEAMAVGCPIVTTNVPGCRDLIRNEETGLLVPYGDTTALSDAMTRLLTDREAASRLGRRAAQDVTEHWHIDRTYTSYTEVYHSILRGV